MYNQQPKSKFNWSRLHTGSTVILGLLVITALYLFTGHNLDLWALLPFGFLIICPLMMFFMMRGMHGGHGDDRGSDHRGHDHQDDK